MRRAAACHSNLLVLPSRMLLHGTSGGTSSMAARQTSRLAMVAYTTMRTGVSVSPICTSRKRQLAGSSNPGVSHTYNVHCEELYQRYSSATLIESDESKAGTSTFPRRQVTEEDAVYVSDLARQPVTRVSVTHLFQACKNPNAERLYLNAQFLRKEVPIRYAHRVHQLRNLPYGLAEDKYITRAADLFTALATEIRNHPLPKCLESRASFDTLLNNVTAATAIVPELIRRAVERLLWPSYKAHRLTEVAKLEQRKEVDRHLDWFFTARIGQRFLVQHYLAATAPQQREGFSGIIQSRCFPAEVCEAAAAEVTRVVTETDGKCPAISVVGDRQATFTFVPSHIFFVLAETLKNACRASIVHSQAMGTALPPVRVIIACGPKDVMIKIEDQGGGFPRSRLADVWSYCNKPEFVKTSDGAAGPPVLPQHAAIAVEAPPATRGMGLPLSRLYAKYFGGTLHLIPMEGYGTDCYVNFNRLGDDNCENIPRVVSESPGGKQAKVDAQEIHSSLFDAQARR